MFCYDVINFVLDEQKRGTSSLVPRRFVLLFPSILWESCERGEISSPKETLSKITIGIRRGGNQQMLSMLGHCYIIYPN